MAAPPGRGRARWCDARTSGPATWTRRRRGDRPRQARRRVWASWYRSSARVEVRRIRNRKAIPAEGLLPSEAVGPALPPWLAFIVPDRSRDSGRISLRKTPQYFDVAVIAVT